MTRKTATTFRHPSYMTEDEKKDYDLRQHRRSLFPFYVQKAHAEATKEELEAVLDQRIESHLEWLRERLTAAKQSILDDH